MSCFVYRLMDPLGHDVPEPFYIGISNNPWYRFYSHSHDKFSAAYPLLSIFLKYGIPRDEILSIYRECATRREAFDLEYELVTTTPNLVNRPYKRGRAYQ